MTVKIDGTNTVANPAFTGADTDTGLQCGTNEVNLVTGGTARLKIDSSGNVGVGSTTITNPYSQPNFTDVNIDGVWGGVISFKLGGAEQGWIGQRNSGNQEMILGASSGKNLLFATNGNNERMRIDSSGNVMVGLTSGPGKLQVAGGIRVAGSASPSDTSSPYIYRSSGADNLCISTSSTERLRIDSSGNVGIGTVPSGLLTSGYSLRLNGGSQTFIAFNNSTHTAQGTGGFSIGNDASAVYLTQRENQPIIFSTNDTERMRILSSGEVKVQEGVLWDYNVGSTDSRSWHVRNDIHAYGDLAFRRSTTQTGSTYETKILFKDTGGICFKGDTADANALDDYEEGEWTPVAQFYDGTITINSADYVKVGQLVHVSMYISFSNTADGSDINITGLPYTVAGDSTNHYSLFTAHTNGDLPNFHLRPQGTSNQMLGVYLTSGNGDSKPSYNNVANKFIIMGGTYRCTP